MSFGIGKEDFDRLICLKEITEKNSDPEEINILFMMAKIVNPSQITTKEERIKMKENKNIFKRLADEIDNCMIKKMRERNKKLWE